VKPLSVLAGESTVALLRSAEAHFAAGDLPAARDALERALTQAASDHERLEILGDLAVVSFTQEQPQTAERYAADALDIDPDHPEARTILDRCIKLREERAYEQVRPMVETRIAEFASISTCVRVEGVAEVLQATLLNGRGRVRLGAGVRFGIVASPGFLSGYGYVDARSLDSVIEIGAGTTFNNNVCIVSEGGGIRIGSNCLFGVDVTIVDSDGHDLHPERRTTGEPATAPVHIGDNVFVGNGVRVNKGVSIGSDTVIGAGSLVTSSLPGGVVAGGVPARVLRALDG
jgi:maltose O-acetyltransferase